MSPTQAAAEYIDNDNYAQEFNRNFFKNGARPAGFLETEMVNETQIETLKISFADLHQGIDNMNRIGVLPKGVKWTSNGASPKDMDFKNLSDDGKERTLAMFGVSRTILGTAESDTNRATAETADYVFSKRVVKPHMMLICATLNEKLIPRYGDNLYITFIDPVPEDRAARTGPPRCRPFQSTGQSADPHDQRSARRVHGIGASGRRRRAYDADHNAAPPAHSAAADTVRRR